MTDPLVPPTFLDAIARAPRSVDIHAAAAAIDGVDAPEAARPLLMGAAGGAPFLRALIHREAAWLSTVWERAPDAVFDEILSHVRGLSAVDDPSAAPTAQGALGRDLRRARRKAALLTALADLGGVWDLDQTTAALTAFAEAVVSTAVDRLLAHLATSRPGLALDPSASGYVVLAMGKMGAGELNYSSDVDLIAVYDQDRAQAVEAGEAFSKMTGALVRLLSEPTSEGYVARVDLRLRPDPSATPLCLSMASAETYYEALARTWERAAHIKARPVAGDLSAGRRYLDGLAPFVWRRHLDFAALEDAADMLSRIRAHEGGAEIAVAGQDVKLGAGGIREIELFAQSRQLVLGGRDPSLRSSKTRVALGALTAAGRLEPSDRARLDAAYVHLRDLEHRLQMIDDRQTHRMPSAPAALDQVAALMGAADWPTLERETRAHMTAVRRIAGADLDGPGAAEPPCEEALSRFQDPERARAIAEAWLTGRLRAVRSARARSALERLSPGLLARIADAPDPMHALLCFDGFLSGLPAGVQFLALVEANPKLLDLLTEICAAAPRLADYLAQRPGVLDAVLDADFFAAPAGLEAWSADIASALAGAADYERRLDAARRWVAEKRFQIGVGLLKGVLAPSEAGPAFSDVAEACLSALAPYVEAEQSRRHGPPPGGGWATLALGRLGSREMTERSDLDVIVVYDAAPTEESVGERPLPAAQYYARLTQKLTSALTAPTSAGALYEVDMRLRPSGRSGPLATSLSAFARYQLEDAWVWEHLALTRARVVSGPASLAEAVRGACAAALSRPRDAAETRAAAAMMRAKLDAAQPGPSRRWEVKFAPGGLFDIEFVAQTEAILAGVAGAGGLSTDAALARLGASGALGASEVAVLREAHALQTALQQIERVALVGPFEPETAGDGVRAAVLSATGAPDLAALEARLDQSQSAARAIFERRIGAAAPVETPP